MAEFSDFHRDVVMQLPGAPIPAVNYALLRAAIEYCEGSLCLQYEAEPIILSAGISDYEIPVEDEQTDVYMVVKAKLNGRFIEPSAVDLRAPTMRPVQTYELLSGEGDDPNSIRLIDAPEEAGTLQLRIAVRPLQDATSLPDELYRFHRQGICAGAMASLMLQGGKAWSQPALGLVRQNEFRAQMNQAQVDANRAQTRADLRVRMRPLA